MVYFVVVHREGALHKVFDVLSRMYEDEDPTEVYAVEVIDHPWYNQHIKDIVNYPCKYYDWKVVEGILYYFRSNTSIDPIFEDQEAWKRTKAHQQALPGLIGKRVVHHLWSLVSVDCMGPYTISKARNS